jgi:3-oxoadipate enol-lactonase
MPSVKVNGIDLWYERSGQGYAVIFLHAFAVTGAMWFPQISFLSKAGYQVICVDLRGHGLSSAPPGPYTVRQLATDVHFLIERLGLNKVCVVGLSTGGRVATRLALDYPEDIAELVLVSTKSEPALEIQTELRELAQVAMGGDVFDAVKQFYEAHYQRLAEAAPQLVLDLLDGWRDKPGSGFASVAVAIVEMESATTRISEIQVPTLTVAGALDPPCHPYVAWYEREISGCQAVIVPDAGHFVNVEKPDRFNELILAFLRANTR